MEGENRYLPGDTLYHMIIGECEDYYYYEKLLNGVYRVFRYPYSAKPILLFDERGYLLPLVKGCNVNYEELSSDQKEFFDFSVEDRQKMLKKAKN